MNFFWAIKDIIFLGLICLFFNLWAYQPLFAQDKRSPTFSINSSFEELHELEAESLAESKEDLLRKIIETHTAKAKTENNKIEIARSFYYRILIEKPELALTYSDSIISITKNSEHARYPTLGYILKAHTLYDIGKFQPALDNYLKAYNYALEKNNKDDQREISLAIAAIRNINGQHSAAADLYKRSLNLLKQKENIETSYYEDYSTLLYNLSLTYLRLFQLDTAKLYVQKGMELSKSVEDKENFRDFVLVDAQINFYEKNFKTAKDSLLKYTDQLNGTSKAIKLYYLGKIEKQLGNDDLAITYFKSIDSIVSVTEDPFDELKDVYQQLIMNSLLKDDEKEQIEYIEKLIHYDSLLSSEQENISNQAVVAYDIPDLKRQKVKAEKQLETKNLYVKLIALLAVVAILTGFYFYNRSRKMKIRLKHLLKGEIERNKTKPIYEHPASVPQDIREDILLKLEGFENSDRFLSKEIDMSILAQDLGTNTTYLSTIINHYKKTSFPNYLKDLKIRAAIHRLSKDPDLLKYNYQGLADTFGFKTGESFSKAFYQKTGVYPSKFLNELKSRKTDRHL